MEGGERRMSGLWYEVAAISRRDEAEVRDIEGASVLVRGHLADLLVIQVPKGVDHQQILQGIQKVLQAENIDKGVFVIDDGIEMMKLVPLARHKAKVMEARHQEAKATARQNAPTTEVPQ